MAGAMRRSIPTALREIQATHERHCIVHDDYFLVMRGADWMGRVHAEMQAPICGKCGERPPLTFKGIDQVEVPDEHVHMKGGRSSEQCLKKLPQSRRKTIRLLFAEHANATIEVPSKDQDRPSRPYGCVAKRTVVGGSIDEKCRMIGGFQLRAISSDFEN
jgi:hypothetical protein